MAPKNQSRKKTRVAFVAQSGQRSRKTGFARTKGATQRSKKSRAYRPHMLVFTKLRGKSGKKSRISASAAANLLHVSRSKLGKASVKSSKTSGKPDYLTIGLTDLATRLFGAEAIQKVKKFTPESNSEAESNSEESTSQTSVRKIWELTSPTVQCNNTIGKYDASTECWICGLSIKPSISGMTAECEHVLPIAQAVIFLQLYNTKKLKGDGHSVSEKNMLDLEYGWAHRLCNQEKSDTCPLRMASEKGVEYVEIFDKGVDEMLKKIWESKRSYADSLVEKLEGKFTTLANFKKDRVPIIKYRYNSIVNYINERRINGVKVPGWAALTLLSGLACATTQDFTKEEFHSILSPEAVLEANRELDATIQADIRRTLGIDAIDGVDGLASIMGLYEQLGAQIEISLLDNGLGELFRPGDKYKELYKEIGLYKVDIKNIIDTIQNNSFKFVTRIYPKLRIYFKTEEKKTYEFIGYFLVRNFIQDIYEKVKKSNEDKSRRLEPFLKNRIEQITAWLVRTSNDMLEWMNEEYAHFTAANDLADIDDEFSGAHTLRAFKGANTSL